MSDRSRNVIVGLTVLTALCMLGGMIVLFAGMPELLQRGYRMRILFDATRNAKEGDPVKLAGVRVGSVTDIAFTGGDPRRGVTFTVLIDRGVRVPADVTPRIHSQGFVGSAYIDLAYESNPMGNPDAQQPTGFIPTSHVVTIMGDTSSTGGMIPPEIADALAGIEEDFRQLGQLANNLNRFLAPAAASGPASQPAQPGRVMTTIAKVDRTLDELHEVIGDRKNQANFKTALGRFTQAGADASEAMASMKSLAEEARESLRRTTRSTTDVSRSVEKLTKRLIDNAGKISTMMATMNRALTKMESGKGTLGRMMNDPQLYNNLTEAARQLGKLVAEMRQLVKTWQSKGVNVKLK